MADENIVRLRITSGIRSAEWITHTIGLPCDKSWRIGDERSKSIIREPKHGWVLNSNLPNTTPLQSHIESLLTRLSPHADKISFLAKEDTVELSCVVYATAPPALNFPSKLIQQLAQLGATLDIDLYLTDDEG